MTNRLRLRLFRFWLFYRLDLELLKDFGFFGDGFLYFLGGSFLGVLEFFVQIADISDTCLRLFLQFKFKAHGHLLEFSALEGKRVLGSGLAVQALENVAFFQFCDWVSSELRDAEVERNDLCCRLTGRYFD